MSTIMQFCLTWLVLVCGRLDISFDILNGSHLLENQQRFWVDVPVPRDACSELQTQYNSETLLLLRPHCSTSIQANFAQHSGAAGVIVTSSELPVAWVEVDPKFLVIWIDSDHLSELATLQFPHEVYVTTDHFQFETFENLVDFKFRRLSACEPSCPVEWLGDGICNDICSSSECGWDGGDCEPDHECSPGCSADMVSNKVCDAECFNLSCGFDSEDCQVEYCSAGCPQEWVGNARCDESCYVYDCSYDFGDCGEHYPALEGSISTQLGIVSFLVVFT